jgi:ABC-type sugar transport system substrate-binding protein
MDNDYQELQREDCGAAARRHGFEMRQLSAQNDPDKQLRQIQECLREPPSMRPVAILVNPVREVVLRPAALEAARLGIGWVSLNRSPDYVKELRRQYPNVAIFSVEPDQRQIGRIQGQQFKVLLPQGGELFYIQGPLLTSTAQERWAGVQQELAGAAFNVVTYSADWSGRGGADVARTWLQSGRRHRWSECIVGAQNDAMAYGAGLAVRDQAAKSGASHVKVHVTGCDGTPGYGQRLVAENHLAATVVVSATAGRAVDEVSSVLDGARPPASDISMEVASFPELSVLMKAARRDA